MLGETVPSGLALDVRLQKITDFKMETNSPGFVNANNQMVVRCTGLPGIDHSQKAYILKCGDCCCKYGTNGLDIDERKCPNCQGGKPGLPLDNE